MAKLKQKTAFWAISKTPLIFSFSGELAAARHISFRFSRLTSQPQHGSVGWVNKHQRPKCQCGFDFAEARVTGRGLESYAVIRDREYQTVLRKECVILSEKDAQRKMALIGKAAEGIGSLVLCPECGTWLFTQPRRRRRTKPAAVLIPA
jgi:hypothetical protein